MYNKDLSLWKEYKANRRTIIAKTKIPNKIFLDEKNMYLKPKDKVNITMKSLTSQLLFTIDFLAFV